MASGVSFILHCIIEHQFIFSATYDSQEERKDKILYPYSRQVQFTIQNDILFFLDVSVIYLYAIVSDRKGNIMLQKFICFFQERNRFVNCSDPGASFYVLGQTG